VRQHNSDAVKDFILPYSAVYLGTQKWKNYWNRSTFAKVIVKIKVAPFLMAHGVYIVASIIIFSVLHSKLSSSIFQQNTRQFKTLRPVLRTCSVN